MPDKKINIGTSRSCDFVYIYLDERLLFCTDNFEEFKSRINALGYALLKRL